MKETSHFAVAGRLPNLPTRRIIFLDKTVYDRRVGKALVSLVAESMGKKESNYRACKLARNNSRGMREGE